MRKQSEKAPGCCFPPAFIHPDCKGVPAEGGGTELKTPYSLCLPQASSLLSWRGHNYV